jgi:guanine deaminase
LGYSPPSFTSDPTIYTNPDDFSNYYEDGGLVISKGYIVDIGNYEEMKLKYPQAPCDDYSGMLVMPGFIDTHVHYPQTQIIGSYGKQLLDWLNDYTYPAEEHFFSQKYSESIAKEFINELFKNGTTTCVAFSTVHKNSVNALFKVASDFKMRIITGKILMDRNAPSDLEDNVKKAYAESKELIDTWHKNGRNLYAITPRFAITCDLKELKIVSLLHRKYPDTYIQTHLAENKDEIKETMELFPDCSDYLNIYEKAGMVTDRSIFAHGIYLSDSELDRIQWAGAVVSHCPTSNLFLGSGLFNMKRANDKHVIVTIATDVGAGTSFSMLQTLNEAYKVQQLNGYAMNAFESFYKATLGAARALRGSTSITVTTRKVDGTKFETAL